MRAWRRDFVGEYGRFDHHALLFVLGVVGSLKAVMTMMISVKYAR